VAGVLAPRAPQDGRTPWEDGFAHMARVLDAELGAGPAVSRRTELFRPLPDDPMGWLLETFPTYFQNSRGVPVAMAPHHVELWDWWWALRPGEEQPPIISILARGGGKSVTVELGATVCGYFGLRRYGLYCCDTQMQANDHLANVGRALEGLGVERAINRYGFSRGWNIQRLSTADGFTLDAVGLDTAMRGVRIDEARPDLIIFDDLDKQLDKPEMIAKKIEILTRDILPTGASSLSVIGVQNLPHKDGIFAQLSDGRAEFLMGRRVVGPYPALADVPEQDWYVPGVHPETGAPILRLTQGTPVWAGQDLAECEAQLNRYGPRGFEIECLHRIARLTGKVFRREWFPVVEDWPRGMQLVRAWDFAATLVDEGQQVAKGKDPDWTVGILLGMWRGQFWVVDMQRVRLSPHGVEQLIAQTAALDGHGVEIWLEEEGGASGKSVTATYRQRVLLGYAVRTRHSTGSKGERAKPVSAAAEAGNVRLVQGYWNAAFLEEVPRFGLAGVHDDIVDALSLAHFALTLGQTLLPSDFSLAKALDGATQPGMEARAQAATAAMPVLGARWGLEVETELV
jgi:predicted phage terminase large subunit-like protein